MTIDLARIKESAEAWKVCIADECRSSCRDEAEVLWRQAKDFGISFTDEDTETEILP